MQLAAPRRRCSRDGTRSIDLIWKYSLGNSYQMQNRVCAHPGHGQTNTPGGSSWNAVPIPSSAARYFMLTFVQSPLVSTVNVYISKQCTTQSIVLTPCDCDRGGMSSSPFLVRWCSSMIILVTQSGGCSLQWSCLRYSSWVLTEQPLQGQLFPHIGILGISSARKLLISIDPVPEALFRCS